jgi:hypothetical protein
MASSLMDKLKHSFSKPQIQVDRPEEQAVVSEPREIKTAPRKQSDSLSPRYALWKPRAAEQHS